MAGRQSGYVVSGLDQVWRRMTRTESRRGSVLPYSPSQFDLRSVSSAPSSTGPEPEELYDRLSSSLFKKELSDKKYSDIIRIAHIVTIQQNTQMEKFEISPRDEITEEDMPDRLERQMSRMFVTLKVLFKYFSKSNPVVVKDLTKFLDQFLEAYRTEELPKKHFNLGSLFDRLHDNFRSSDFLFCLLKTKKVLKFMHISVVIAAIEEIRTKLKLGLEHLTKDIRTDNGWNVVLKLDERFVEVRHMRREAVLKQKGTGEHNYWEVAYNITASFDDQMEVFSAVRLAVTDLQVSDDMDDDYEAEIKQKFFNGKFIIS